MSAPLHHRKVSWLFGGTELRLVSYLPGGSVYLQQIGEGDHDIIEVPRQLLGAVVDQLVLMQAENTARPA